MDAGRAWWAATAAGRSFLWGSGHELTGEVLSTAECKVHGLVDVTGATEDHFSQVSSPAEYNAKASF